MKASTPKRLAMAACLPLALFLMGCPGNKTTTVGTSPAGDTTSRPDSVAPFPSGYNYPVTNSEVQTWVDSSEMDSIRNHGWNLWIGINSQAPGTNKLVWQTWYSVSQAFLNESTTPSALASIRMRHGWKPTGAQATETIGLCNVVPSYDNVHNPNMANIGADNGFLANNGDIMIAGVYYNWEAYRHMRDKKLYLKSTLQALQKPGTPGGNIPDFPSGSIVLKHMFWPVKQDGFSALPVWHNNPVCPNAQYNGYETWTDAVAIDPTNSSKQKMAPVSYLHNVGQNSPKGPMYPTKNFLFAKVVPMSNFFSWKIDASTWNAMTTTDQGIINNAFQWAYGRNFEPGDYLVSIAMHIITKEYYNWTMQSLWWSDEPNNGPYAANRPANVSAGTWSNYMLTSAYSMVDQSGASLTAYNPYIELVVGEQNRIISNCQNCHVRGAFPEATTTFLLDPIGGNNPAQGDSSHYNSSQTGQINPTDPIFKNLVRTDFSWAIPDSPIGMKARLQHDALVRRAIERHSKKLRKKFPNIRSVSDAVHDMQQTHSHIVVIYLADDRDAGIPQRMQVKHYGKHKISVPVEVVKNAGKGFAHIAQGSHSIGNGSVCCLVRSLSDPGFIGVVTSGHVLTDGNFDDRQGVLPEEPLLPVLISPGVQGNWFLQRMTPTQDIAVAALTQPYVPDAGYRSFSHGYYDITDHDIKTPAPNVTIISKNNVVRDAYVLDHNVPVQLGYSNKGVDLKGVILLGDNRDRNLSNSLSAPGDSGSCVFHSQTGKLIGILTGGDLRFSFVLPLRDALSYFNLQPL